MIDNDNLQQFNKICIDDQANRLIETITRTVVKHPVTVEEIIQLIKFYGLMSDYGVNLYNVFMTKIDEA